MKYLLPRACCVSSRSVREAQNPGTSRGRLRDGLGRIEVFSGAPAETLDRARTRFGTVKHVMELEQTPVPGKAVLAADFVGVPEHRGALVDSRRNQRRFGRQTLEQKQLIVPQVARPLV